MQACSHTGALNDVFEQKKALFDVYKDGIQLEGGEVGRSFFEKYEPIDIGEDWRYDGKQSFGKAAGRAFDAGDYPVATAKPEVMVLSLRSSRK
ncbi:MAG TPA: hypothetical protein VGK27_03520 [Candidatus Deferrimicrobiaceae bacterium]|jgi:hypothetical protein